MTETTTPAAETPEIEGAPETGSKAGREAAKYRRQLREVEAERDSLRAFLSASRQALIERSLSDFMTVEYEPEEGANRPYNPDGTPKPMTATLKLKHASDFTTFTGLTADDLTGEDGTLDQVKINDALAGLWKQRGELFEQAQSDRAIPTIGQTPDSTPPSEGFAGAFAPKK